MNDGPKDFIDMMLKNIVGIELEITKLVGKFKLSQNKGVRNSDAPGVVNTGREVKREAPYMTPHSIRIANQIPQQR
jgi:predicted FMN-binding regulatory protein PaiB